MTPEPLRLEIGKALYEQLMDSPLVMVTRTFVAYEQHFPQMARMFKPGAQSPSVLVATWIYSEDPELSRVLTSAERELIRRMGDKLVNAVQASRHRIFPLQPVMHEITQGLF